MSDTIHQRLSCGMEYAVMPLPQRHVVALQLRILTGATNDPSQRLGLSRLVGETLDKGTSRHSGRELSDAFDTIGASHGIGVGRETTTLSCTVLPEHFDRAVELIAELVRTPTFPEEAVSIHVDLAKQELVALEDDPQSLVDKLISRQAYGPVMGRHVLGEAHTLERISRDDLVGYWRSHFHAGRMLLSAAGAIDPERVANRFEQHFSGFGGAEPAGRDALSIEFSAQTFHRSKDLQQQQIGICWPGVDATHPDFPTQQVLLGVLSGGMSGRLFTEVREKQGLVYWVSAWQETPRGTGLIFLGASTRPDRCDKTYRTLLREVDRLAEDITPDELDRAITGIVAARETRGDSTRAYCSELASDLFFFGRPISAQEKIAKVQAVTIEDIRRYLQSYPRDRLCVVTLGPTPLSAEGNSHRKGNTR